MPRRISDDTRARIAAAWLDIIAQIEARGVIGPILREYGFTRDQMTCYVLTTPGAKADWDAAKESSADSFADRALDIALNPYEIITHDHNGEPLTTPHIIKADPAHARNAIDTLKWAARIRNPRTYSDKSSIDLNVKTVDLTAIIRDANARLAAAHSVGRIIEGNAVQHEESTPALLADLL